MSDVKHQRRSYFFDEEVLAELRAEAERLGRPYSWVAQAAWRIARDRMREMPMATCVEATYPSQRRPTPRRDRSAAAVSPAAPCATPPVEELPPTRRYVGGPMGGDEDPRHGTTYGYYSLGCRCERCREAYRTTYRRQRAKRAAVLATPATPSPLPRLAPPPAPRAPMASTKGMCRCGDADPQRVDPWWHEALGLRGSELSHEAIAGAFESRIRELVKANEAALAELRNQQAALVDKAEHAGVWA